MSCFGNIFGIDRKTQNSHKKNPYGRVSQLLEKCFGKGLGNDGGVTAIHTAVENNLTITIDTLVKSGHDVNATDNNGRTPLYYAIQLSRQTMIKKLKDHGASEDLLLNNMIGAFNNIDIDGEIQTGDSLVGEYMMNKIMSTMTQGNELYNVTEEEKTILSKILNNTDRCELHHPPISNHATGIVLFSDTNISYLIHTNRGKSAFRDSNQKAIPLVIYSNNYSRIQVVLKQLDDLIVQNKITMVNTTLNEFQSEGGNKNFIEAIKSMKSKCHKIRNCWIKSQLQALKIRMFISFLQEEGFEFNTENSSDNEKIQRALHKANKLIRKVRLNRVLYCEEISENTTTNSKLLSELESKKSKIESKLNPITQYTVPV